MHCHWFRDVSCLFTDPNEREACESCFGRGLVVVDVLHSSVVREWNNQNPHCSIEAGMLVMEVETWDLHGDAGRIADL